MSSDKTSLLVAGVIVSGVVAATAGMVVRDRIDLPISPGMASGPLQGTRMASRQDPSEGIDIPEREYFEQLVDMLKQVYVESIQDEQKLVDGAIRGMVGSLEDPHSLYYDRDAFAALQNAREGKYQGIGADFIYTFAPKTSNSAGPRVPKLVVSAVVPDGPAAKAGVKPGDVVDSVDGRWVVNLDMVERFRDLQAKVQEKKADPEELRKLRLEFRKKSEHSTVPAKAREKLYMGTTGEVKVVWLRAGKPIETVIPKASSLVPAVAKGEGGLRVRLMPGVGASLKAHPGVTRLDLRNNPFADVSAVNEALEALAPAGTYGRIVNERGGSLTLKSSRADKTRPSLTLIVDSSTRGGAAILARALESKGLAKLEGTPNEAVSVEVFSLPNGTGFTLTKGYFKPEVAK